MSFIHFHAASCKNCYRCIRSCPVQAIEFKNNQARILDEACISCGECLAACPQNAKTVDSDVVKVNAMLRRREPVIVSLAPSFVGYFEDPEQLKRELLALGFDQVRETAEAAAEVSKQYAEQYRLRGGLLTTACPVVVEMIDHYYPSLIPWMAEVDSPMIAHGKWLKSAYPGVKVVFIGPCYAKKKEMEAQPQAIDAILTFDEIVQLRPRWALACELEQENTALKETLAEVVDGSSSTLLAARVYPLEGGVMESSFPDGPPQPRHRAISGIDSIKKLFESLKRPPLGYFLELNACAGSCVNGPVSGTTFDWLEKQDRISAYSTKPREDTPLPPLEPGLIRRTYQDRSKPAPVHAEEDIREVLRKIGKRSRSDELNCGACGYRSCREKAAAVLEGKAELFMCMPYMQERAESFAQVVLEHTPNAVLAVSEQHLIKEANDAAAGFFELAKQHLIGLPLSFLIDEELAPLDPEVPVRRKMDFAMLNKTAIVTISYVADQQVYLAILHDVTEREREQEKRAALKKETVEMAQRVIQNQMLVAQEIASLLGETTAETKVTMTKLKRLLLEEGT